jgi:hypothetical protein
MEKKSGFETVYDKAGAGAIAFQNRAEVGPQIDALLATLHQLEEEYQGETQVVEALHEIEMKLQALRLSEEPLEAIQQKVQSLTEVPFGPDKKLNLAAFRKRAAGGPLANEAEYLAHVKRLVRNTMGNLAQLLVSSPDDSILQRFMKELQELNPSGDFKSVKLQMEKFSKSPQLWHYNERKKAFLLEWLRPFQTDLGKPLEKMTAEELQEALKKVEKLRDTKLEQSTNLAQEKERGPYRAYNRQMHPVMNGKNKDFWGGAEVRDEFIHLMSKIISRFSFNLEDRFLVFRTKDGGFSYLVGFADDAFSDAVAMEGGKLALYPHLKAFLHSGEKQFHEIDQKDYPGDSSAYFRALKTAVVPFLMAISVMVEFELSKQLKESFDMWT